MNDSDRKDTPNSTFTLSARIPGTRAHKGFQLCVDNINEKFNNKKFKYHIIPVFGKEGQVDIEIYEGTRVNEAVPESEKDTASSFSVDQELPPLVKHGNPQSAMQEVLEEAAKKVKEKWHMPSFSYAATEVFSEALRVMMPKLIVECAEGVQEKRSGELPDNCVSADAFEHKFTTEEQRSQFVSDAKVVCWGINNQLAKSIGDQYQEYFLDAIVDGELGAKVVIKHADPDKGKDLQERKENCLQTAKDIFGFIASNAEKSQATDGGLLINSFTRELGYKFSGNKDPDIYCSPEQLNEFPRENGYIDSVAMAGAIHAQAFEADSLSINIYNSKNKKINMAGVDVKKLNETFADLNEFLFREQGVGIMLVASQTDLNLPLVVNTPLRSKLPKLPCIDVVVRENNEGYEKQELNEQVYNTYVKPFLGDLVSANNSKKWKKCEKLLETLKGSIEEYVNKDLCDAIEKHKPETDYKATFRIGTDLSYDVDSKIETKIGSDSKCTLGVSQNQLLALEGIRVDLNKNLESHGLALGFDKKQGIMLYTEGNSLDLRVLDAVNHYLIECVKHIDNPNQPAPKLQDSLDIFAPDLGEEVFLGFDGKYELGSCDEDSVSNGSNRSGTPSPEFKDSSASAGLPGREGNSKA